jgi:asparagine synthase (glutamine-hydrolysing)
MSGIAAIINFDGRPAEPARIAKITRAMASRGPDGSNHWVKGPVALGQCMLRTTPRSLEETQPLLNEDESVVLVMDGRIDNDKELRTGLLARGARLRTRADAELVLRAYEMWGKDCPTHLLGDFAFVIWDARRNELFCARDHFGVKPFHYFKGPDFLVLASDEEAFLDLPDVPRKVNEDRIAYILAPDFDGVDFNDSWLQGIVKLPPGKTLCVRPSGASQIATYWQLEPQDESRFSSDAECEEAFRSIFGEAVRCRVRSLGNPALMLSGGMDSASIAGAARSLPCLVPGAQLHTYSVVSDNAATCGETRNIHTIIKGHEQQAHLLCVPSFRGEFTDDDWRDIAWNKSHPANNSLALETAMLMAAARNGHRVMCDGIDGDLSTYARKRYYSTMMHSGAWREAWAECRQSHFNNTYLNRVSPVSMMMLGLWDVAATPRARRLKDAIAGVVKRWTGSNRDLIDPDFAKRLRIDERIHADRGLGNDDSPLSDQEFHIRALKHGSIARSMDIMDRVAAKFGIEPRHPWSDKRVLDFYLRLPLRYKVRNGWTKYLVRTATQPWLDESVRLHTGKAHLGMEIVRRIVKVSEQKMHDILTGEGEQLLNPYVNRKVLRSMRGSFEAAPEAVSGEDIANLFYMTTVASWIQRIQTDGT